MTIQDIQSLAEAHGLLLTDKMNFNEMGIDFTDRKFNRMRPSMARVLGLETRSAKEG